MSLAAVLAAANGGLAVSFYSYGREGLPGCSHSLCCLSYWFFKLPGLCPFLREMGSHFIAL